eukprot:TRINITY_DN24650_c0_g1_i1.p1 TRINITY_DN24650_c0_g1~~TRINITY_DN24650_c0_g1_i1.p1  ORF type:complete len:210 (-),score=77.00 TRINITY_DN24650_c0_g1_i1:83-712(-)
MYLAPLSRALGMQSSPRTAVPGMATKHSPGCTSRESVRTTNPLAAFFRSVSNSITPAFFSLGEPENKNIIRSLRPLVLGPGLPCFGLLAFDRHAPALEHGDDSFFRQQFQGAPYRQPLDVRHLAGIRAGPERVHGPGQGLVGQHVHRDVFGHGGVQGLGKFAVVSQGADRDLAADRGCDHGAVVGLLGLVDHGDDQQLGVPGRDQGHEG